MTTLAEIYGEYEAHGVKLYQRHFPLGGATIEMDGRYAVFVDLFCDKTPAEQKLRLAHELGHCVTGSTHRVASPHDLVERHEHRANTYAALRFYPPEDFKMAFALGYRTPWELAEWLDAPEWFVLQAYQYYKDNQML